MRRSPADRPDPAVAHGTVTGRGTDVMASAAERGPAGGNASDAAGAVILAACAIWSLISAAGRETRPEGVLLALLAVAAGFACGRGPGSAWCLRLRPGRRWPAGAAGRG
ncbi:hypothetical protein AMK09_29785 [Streptomyces sp. CB02488]|nr:hypothetical protein AMK09_29785 [Streptomyces sp. CB02488]